MKWWLGGYIFGLGALRGKLLPIVTRDGQDESQQSNLLR